MAHVASGEILARTREEGRAALIGYLPVGFPTLQQSIEAATAMVDAGVDIVELGIPYSDPVMDGPVIQHAATEALSKGFRVDDAFRAVEAVAATGAAVLTMTYWNIVVHRGVDAYSRQLAEAGGAGIITADLIPDEADEWFAASDEHGLDRVFLVAPSSTPERLAMTTAACRGFIYASSVMGVTGERTSLGDRAGELVRRCRDVTDTPVGVGIGVSTREHAREVAQFADGVIVGTALVKNLTTESVAWSARLDALAQTVSELRAGIDDAVHLETN